MAQLDKEQETSQQFSNLGSIVGQNPSVLPSSGQNQLPWSESSLLQELMENTQDDDEEPDWDQIFQEVFFSDKNSSVDAGKIEKDDENSLEEQSDTDSTDKKQERDSHLENKSAEGEIPLKILLQREKKEALTMMDPLEDAQCTVILVDTSYSMRGQPFEFAVTAVRNFLIGLSNMPELKENVALVSYGEDLCVHQHLTSNYNKLFDALDGLRIVKESNLSNGLMLCAPVLERVRKPVVNGVVCNPRILIIGNFESPLADDEQSTSHKLLNSAEEMIKNLRADFNVSVYCIPVTKNYQMVATQLARAGDGTVVIPGDISQLCNLYLQRLLAGVILGEQEAVITDETIYKVINKLEFDDFLNDMDLIMIKRIISATAPDRVGFSASLVPSFTVNQTRTTEDIMKTGTSQHIQVQSENNQLESTVITEIAEMQPEHTDSQETEGRQIDDSCSADVSITTIPGTDHSDLESSVLQSELQINNKDFVWMWKDGAGEWKSYPEDVNRKLEKSFQNNQRSCIVLHNGQQARIVFKTMRCKNLTLKTESDVQRREVDLKMDNR